MKSYRKLKNDYELLENQYMTLYAEKLELEYRCHSLDAEYTYQKEQSDEILKLHENARKLKHDMKNHLLVIASYLQDHQLDETKKYLSKILDKLNHMYTYIETGNSLLSHILNAKLEEAQNKGMIVKAQIENLSFSRMDSVDFSVILTNILDNAIEHQTNNRAEILVEIAKKRGYETIVVKNRIEESVLERNPSLKSTKNDTDEHGFGVKQIKEVVMKYQGLIDFYEEDSMFCVCVMIPAGDIL